MKTFITIGLLTILYITPDEYKSVLVTFFSVVWFLYTIYYAVKLYKIKDKKINTDKYSTEPPNHQYSPYIRYLCNGKVDYKVFFATIMELILKKSIILCRKDKDKYYLIDGKVEEEELTKNEMFVKNILFCKIGDKDQISLREIKEEAKYNSGYFHYVYNEWKNLFVFESAKFKYFKPIKPIIDNGLFYFMLSIVLSILNIVINNYIYVAFIIFLITSLLIKSVNDYCNREDDAKVEYKSWLEFKNYIKKEDNDLSLLDIKSLENYATYAYVLDEMDSFLNILYKKYESDNTVFDNSVLLSIMNFRIFDDIEETFKKSINLATVKSVVFFSRNRGRRI